MPLLMHQASTPRTAVHICFVVGSLGSWLTTQTNVLLIAAEETQSAWNRTQGSRSVCRKPHRDGACISEMLDMFLPPTPNFKHQITGQC